MEWVAFAYSLPTKAPSSPRVALWRRLRRLGAVPAKGRVYVLPARDDCAEGFQWLAREVEDAGGEAVVMRLQRFEGLSDARLIEKFRTVRQEDYRILERELRGLERSARGRRRAGRGPQLRATFNVITRHHTELARIDFFPGPDHDRFLARLDAVERALVSDSTRPAAPKIVCRAVSNFQSRRWVTRPRPHVDRLACAWFIRKFINPQARIRYELEPKADEVRFDMERADFGHVGNLCTFEVMVRAFGIDEPALEPIGQIVHDIDLRDERYLRPEATGVDLVLEGWLAADLSDADLEAQGIGLFEGLYRGFSRTIRNARTRGRRRGKR